MGEKLVGRCEKRQEQGAGRRAQGAGKKREERRVGSRQLAACRKENIKGTVKRKKIAVFSLLQRATDS